MNLLNKVALVTGGASGIGLACAEEFLANGIKSVALVDIDEINGKKVGEELNKKYENRSIFIKANVVDKSDLKSAFQKTVETFGNLDIVLNNAGTGNEVEPIKCYDVNVVGVTNCLQLAIEEYLPKYKSSETDGIIINVASHVALYPRQWYMVPIYTTSKCAVLGLTMTFGHAFYYEKTGVKVIAICPGQTITPLSKIIDQGKIIHIEEVRKAVKNMPTQESSELAKNLLIILEKAKTGSIWEMDGGKIEEMEFLNKLDCSSLK